MDFFNRATRHSIAFLASGNCCHIRQGNGHLPSVPTTKDR